MADTTILIIKGLKFRLYPNAQQREQIARTFGCCRLIYNKGLAMRRDTYRETGKGAAYGQTSAMIHSLSETEEYSFLKDVSSVAMQQALRDLDSAYSRFFKHLGGYPHFKKKTDGYQSFRIQNKKSSSGTPNIRIEGKYIRIPTIGLVKLRQTMPVGKITNATIERTPTGKYYVVLCVETETVNPIVPYTDSELGIDVGLKSFLSDTDGNVVENPRWFRRTMKKLRREQRKLSRMIEKQIAGYTTGKKGGRVPIYAKPLGECRNIQKQKTLVARIYEKVTTQRYDFQQKLSTRIVKENQLIGVENLNIAGMKKNRHLSLSIHDAAWGQFLNMLEYKAGWYGRTLIKVPTFFPSSQTCHVCGYKNLKVRNLGIREWTCPDCGTRHDRDNNAAHCIRSKAKQIAEELTATI